ncbi:SPFH domain-containing protein [Demequina sediminicola]|uniref:SPFH domain-containing protein n=1 Tax=Demequina sediminicola TaxID=1095026 RepID=UPI000785263D|nr:SPFH domain-containing protein [Demequina sediminicola]
MGFIRAFSGAIGGTFADQWLDFLTPPTGVSATALLFPAVAQGTNAGRGSNTQASENIISNGSKVVVPAGYGLLTFQDGRITNFIAESGGYIYNSDDQQGQSLFAGDGIISPTVKTSWERFKFGGQPGSQHLAFYVSLKEVPDNRFGTQGPIYWDDHYLGTQAGAVTRGSYTLKIVDPILFVNSIVPAPYISASAGVFDLNAAGNPVADQLFNEVVGSLSAAFSNYTNAGERGNRISRIQGDALGFSASLSQVVEENFHWATERGIIIDKAALVAIEYDAPTAALLADVQKADALSGARGDSFLRQSAARGIQSAGESGGGDGLAFMGMGMNAAGGALGGLMQNQGGPQQGMPQGGAQAQQAAPQQGQAAAAAEPDPMAELRNYKAMLDEGLITQEDFDAVKKKVLGL